MRRFLLAFIGIGLLLYGLVYLPPVREQIIAPFTDGLTVAAGGVITLFHGQAWVQATVLTIPGFSVRILDLCNGVEATLLLWTAMLAFPAPWRHRLIGLLIGLLGVHTLNLARIVSLEYLGAASSARPAAMIHLALTAWNVSSPTATGDSATGTAKKNAP